MQGALQEVLAGIEEIEAADQARRDALDQAVGMIFDDVVDPLVGVAVWKGRVMDIQIADRLCRRGGQEVMAVLNAAIINAFAAWQKDFVRLLNDAGGPSA